MPTLNPIHNNHSDSTSKVSDARAYLMCTEAILLDIKSVNVDSQTAELELWVAIQSMEVFLNKAKELLTG